MSQGGSDGREQNQLDMEHEGRSEPLRGQVIERPVSDVTILPMDALDSSRTQKCPSCAVVVDPREV